MFIKEIKSYKNYLISFLIALITSYYLSIYDLLPHIDSSHLVSGNVILSLFLFIVIYLEVNHLLLTTTWKTLRPAIMFSFLFSLLLTLGRVMYSSFPDFVFNQLLTINILLHFITYIVILTLILQRFNKLIKKIPYENRYTALPLSNKTILYLIIMTSVIFLLHLIYLFPGVYDPDSISQMSQIMTDEQYTNHHPIAHTLFVMPWVKLAVILGLGKYGAFLYLIAQSVVIAIIIGILTKYLSEQRVPRYVVYIFYIFMSFHPLVARYAITLWKDINFSYALLLYIFLLYRIFVEDNFFTKKSNLIFFWTVAASVMLFRNNGYYVILLGIPILIYFYRKERKILTIGYIALIALYFFITGPTFKWMNIKAGGTQEALTIPIQQMARVVYFHKDQLTIDEQNQIATFFSFETAQNKYLSHISDPVKETFNNDVFHTDKRAFLNIWWHLFTKYPGDYTKAILYQTSGSWYPNYLYWIVRPDHLNIAENYVGLEASFLVNQNIQENIFSYFYRLYLTTPILRITTNVPIIIWFTTLLFAVYVKRYRLHFLPLFLQLFILYLTIFASPVCAEFRYSFAFFLVNPFLLALLFAPKMKPNNNNQLAT